MIVFDTDLLIWYFRGNHKAEKLLSLAEAPAISIQTYMELMQGAHHKEEQRAIRHFFNAFHFPILPLTDSIGHRAAIYIEEYALSNGIQSADALIAATAIEHGAPLVTGNAKHFQVIPGLELTIFKS